jgi:hypothetical protein
MLGAAGSGLAAPGKAAYQGIQTFAHRCAIREVFLVIEARLQALEGWRLTVSR